MDGGRARAGQAAVHRFRAGLTPVMGVELGLITCAGVFDPVLATYRLEHTATDHVARVLSAWPLTGKLTTRVP
ncbi:hypothetical protein AB0H86_22075 [Streptomyces sp. NPDC050997]|uniref:hypothetical protein n=1 Tax=Streptomyces sp. NPDC050997 TaxID=3155519 RepID=UPI0034495A24